MPVPVGEDGDPCGPSWRTSSATWAAREAFVTVDGAVSFALGVEPDAAHCKPCRYRPITTSAAFSRSTVVKV